MGLSRGLAKTISFQYVEHLRAMNAVERYRGSRLGLAAGDALGSTLEFSPPEIVPPALLRKWWEAALLISRPGNGKMIHRWRSASRKARLRKKGSIPLTNSNATASIANDNVEALFQFGEQSRKELKEFLETFPTQKWDVPEDHKLGNHVLTQTPRKIVVHVVLHEIRHWAQIATLLRLNGLSGEFHNFLFSPVMGGVRGREQAGV